MRILIYNWRDLTHPKAGGAEVYTDSVARVWSNEGHEVTLFTSAVQDHPDDEVGEGGYRIVRRGGRLGVYREARRFWRREGRGNFDLVIDEVNTKHARSGPQYRSRRHHWRSKGQLPSA